MIERIKVLDHRKDERGRIITRGEIWRTHDEGYTTITPYVFDPDKPFRIECHNLAEAITLYISL